MTIRDYHQPLPHLTTEQMREVDRAMIEDAGIELIQMMENAGRCLAMVATERFLAGDARGKTVMVLAGTGGNGGGALVAARRLHGWGARVQVWTTRPPDAFGKIPRHQLDIVKTLALPVKPFDHELPPGHCDLVLDGVIGYSLGGPPRGSAAAMIRWANTQAAAVLSLDVPSGVDTGSGTAFDPAVTATGTMTLALPKVGLRAADAEPHVGELYLADIGVPRELYAPLGLVVPDSLFAGGDLVRLG